LHNVAEDRLEAVPAAVAVGDFTAVALGLAAFMVAEAVGAAPA
jgi:hypothetical protein